MDPLQHPDLVVVGRRLRTRLDDTLDAELAAARAAAARRRTLRDLFLDADDAGRTVVATTVDGFVHRGRVTAVGADHVVLSRTDGRSTAVVIDLVCALEHEA
ncbi:MAG: hypothetical protein R3290_03480 [Acidimicrobiia bacterium]|nr:hypothetical protein [Acidimicrobiia bacterium]